MLDVEKQPVVQLEQLRPADIWPFLQKTINWSLKLCVNFQWLIQVQFQAFSETLHVILDFFSFISLSSLRLVKIKCTKILIQMFTSGQSDNSHLKCLLEQQNIVGVWRLASDPITPHWYVYTDMFIHRYWGVMSRTSWTPSRSLQVDAGGAPRTCSNTDGCFCSLTRPPNWQDAFGRWVWRVGHVMCVAVQLEWSAWRVFPLLKHKILWNVQKH